MITCTYVYTHMRITEPFSSSKDSKGFKQMYVLLKVSSLEAGTGGGKSWGYGCRRSRHGACDPERFPLLSKKHLF